MVRTAKSQELVYGTKGNDIFIRQGYIIHVDLFHLFTYKMVILTTKTRKNDNTKSKRKGNNTE